MMSHNCDINLTSVLVSKTIKQQELAPAHIPTWVASTASFIYFNENVIFPSENTFKMILLSNFHFYVRPGGNKKVLQTDVECLNAGKWQ